MIKNVHSALSVTTDWSLMESLDVLRHVLGDSINQHQNALVSFA